MIVSNFKKINYAEKFLKDRKKLRKNYSKWSEIDINDKVLTFNSPDLLAGFASYLKFQLNNTEVYFRGEENYHETMIPKLFRFNNNVNLTNKNIENNVDFTNENIEKILQAHISLISYLPIISKASRFRQKDFNSVLQHYGIKTPWIDLVDNIFIALWFSNRNANKKIDFTYIKFFATQLNNYKLKTIDLRESYSSLSLRPHCQHGISATKENNKWNVNNCDFSNNLIAVAKIPNIPEFKLNGHIFSKKYMFPNEIADNTLKILKNEKFSYLLNMICKKHKLERNELGIVD